MSSRRTLTLAVQIITEAKDAARGFDDTTKQASKFERGMARANRAALVVGGGLLAIGGAARKQASDLQQADGAVQAVYGAQSDRVRQLAKDAATDLGLARSEYSQLSAVFGAQMKNMGVAADQLVPTTDKLITLGGDLAAMYGGTTADAVEALGSLMRGERDPIEQYGVSIKQADVNAALAAKGQDKLTGAARRAAETEATLAILYEQTASAQGQRAREANTDAVRTEQALARLKNAGAALGMVLLPITASIAAGLARVFGFVEQNSTAFQILAVVVGGTAAAVILINGALKAYRATTAAVVAVQTAWNVALSANPIGLVIIAVAALVAGFVLLYKRSETFRNAVQQAGRLGRQALEWVVSTAKSVGTWLGDNVPAAIKRGKDVAVKAIDAYTWPIRKIIELVQELVGWIRDIDFPEPPGWVRSIGSGIGSVFGSFTPAGAARGAASAMRPSVLTRPGELTAAMPAWATASLGGRLGAGYVQIVVQGALDPERVAAQIEQLLRRRGLRIGTRTA